MNKKERKLLRNKIRSYLHNLEGLDEKIKDLASEIKIMKSLGIEYCINSVLSDMPKAQGNANKIENAVIKRITFIEALETELLTYLDIKRKINTVLLLGLTEKEKTVYQKRFREKEAGDNSFDKISRDMGLSFKGVSFHENSIITKIERVW